MAFMNTRGARATVLAALVGVGILACGGGDDDDARDDDAADDDAAGDDDGGDSGIEPPAPVCLEAGGSSQAAAPELAFALSDRGAESWLASPIVADLDGDGTPEIAAARDDTLTVWRADGEVAWRASTDGRIWSSPVAADLDPGRDGLELAAAARSRIHAWDASGEPLDGFPFEWRDEMRSLAAGDIDGDGDPDLVTRVTEGAGRHNLVVLRNDGGSRQASLRVRLDGKVSNRSAVGSKVELRAGSLRQKLETASAWPAAAPSDLVFGLGGRASADVVRVIWPAGIVQAELAPGAALAGTPGTPTSGTPGTPATPAATSGPGVVAHGTMTFTELDRKPSSCPYLFTWNGERFEFITDFMGGGEMGYLHAPGVVGHPDPEEYTRIEGARLVPRRGRYELQVTNELEETLFLDRARLIAVDHPAAVEVHPREGAFAPPFPAFRLYAAAGARPIVRALDGAGRDVTARLTATDRQYVDRLPLERIRGYAKPHTLTLDLGEAPAGGGVPLLLLTGWTDYAFSTDNVAAHQAGLPLEPPSLQIRDANGQWRTAIVEIGIPVGRPQTIVVDLSRLRFHGAREVRIATSMRVYWDRAQVATEDGAVQPRQTALDAVRADLAWRGFSAEVTPDGREPYDYDFTRVSPIVPWKLMPGRYTREGDVRELLRTADDFFVVSRPGDALALAFDATKVPPLPTGWTRTFLLHSIGYSKEMDPHSASPDVASPLPFRTMTRYPYAAPERYPDTPAHRAYLDRWNTRVVGRTLPPLELAADAAGVPARVPRPAGQGVSGGAGGGR
jgi:hypothetical protein